MEGLLPFLIFIGIILGCIMLVFLSKYVGHVIAYLKHERKEASCYPLVKIDHLKGDQKEIATFLMSYLSMKNDCLEISSTLDYYYEKFDNARHLWLMKSYKDYLKKYKDLEIDLDIKKQNLKSIPIPECLKSSSYNFMQISTFNELPFRKISDEALFENKSDILLFAINQNGFFYFFTPNYMIYVKGDELKVTSYKHTSVKLFKTVEEVPCEEGYDIASVHWLHERIRGGPDRRFRVNYQLYYAYEYHIGFYLASFSYEEKSFKLRDVESQDDIYKVFLHASR